MEKKSREFNKGMCILTAKVVRNWLGNRGYTEFADDATPGKDIPGVEEFVYECIDDVDTKKECIVDNLHTRQHINMIEARDVVTQMLPRLLEQGRIERVSHGYYRRLK